MFLLPDGFSGNNPFEIGLADNFDAQLIGFGQFRRADIIAGQQIIGIGRNSSLILAAVRLDQLFQLIARMSFERPRNDDLFTVETIRKTRRFPGFEMQAARLQPLQNIQVRRIEKVIPHADSDPLADRGS